MIKLAVVGYGGMGAYHCKSIKENCSDILKVTGCYDIDEKRMEVARKDGYRTYESFDEIASDEEVDAVLLTVPNDCHLPYAKKCALSGKHILTEKPAALSSYEFEEMMKAAKDGNVELYVHQNRRWDADFLTVKNIYDSQPLGKVYRIESRVMGSNGIPGDWRKVKSQGGGMVLDWGVHLIDQAITMIKSKIKSVYADLSFVFGHEVDDGCRIEMKFENGVEYLVVVDTNCFIPLPRWEVYAYDGTAVVKNWEMDGYMIAVKERVDKNLKGIQAGNGFTKTMADRSKSSIEEMPLDKAKYDPRAFYVNFVRSLEGKEKRAIQNGEVLEVMKIMEAAFKSYERKEIVTEI